MLSHLPAAGNPGRRQAHATAAPGRWLVMPRAKNLGLLRDK
jgi:hypothetical protein